MKTISRREFIKQSIVTAGAIPLLGVNDNLWAMGNESEKLPVCIFSKHLQFLDWRSLGEKVAEMGLEGITVFLTELGFGLLEP